MNILVGNNHLRTTGGTENYTFTLALELKKQGHDVEYFTFNKGEVSDLLEKNGIPFMSQRHYDLILANHKTVIEHLQSYGFIIQTCHGVVPYLEQPSSFADAHVCVTDEIRRHLLKKGYDSTIILNGIDCERFSPRKPLSGKLSSVLSICQSEEMDEFIKDCCDTIGVDFHSCNKNTDNVWDIDHEINNADLVVGIGRSLYDAMACGRCVISYDKRSYVNAAIGDGYMTADNFHDAVLFNCSGRGLRKTFTKEEFIAELQKYDPADGEWARATALESLNISKAVEQYLAIYGSYLEKHPRGLALRCRKVYNHIPLGFKRTWRRIRRTFRKSNKIHTHQTSNN